MYNYSTLLYELLRYPVRTC